MNLLKDALNRLLVHSVIHDEENDSIEEKPVVISIKKKKKIEQAIEDEEVEEVEPQPVVNPDIPFEELAVFNPIKKTRRGRRGK